MTFAAQLVGDFTPIAAVYDDASVTRALSWAQSFVENYCTRVFDLVENETVVIDPKIRRCAMLPEFPVTAVSSVQALLPGNGGLVWTDLTNFAFTEDGLIYDTTGMPGVSFSTGLTWPWVPGGLKVTYSHGYEPVPQALIDTACRLAQQYLENPTLRLQGRAGDIEARYAGSAGVVLNEFDAQILSQYKEVGLA